MDCDRRTATVHDIQHSTAKSCADRVPVPPLAEQQRIVGILDEAFAGIATAKANAEKNLQNARALFESHLQSVFTQRGKGWVEKTLGDVCEFIDDGWQAADEVSKRHPTHHGGKYRRSDRRHPKTPMTRHRLPRVYNELD